MGQKVDPLGFRLGINRTWDSRWFTTRNFDKWLEEDIIIRRYLRKRLVKAGISRIIIERQSDRVRITIYTARPGMVIGRKGAEVDFLSEELAHLTDKEINLDIKEVKRPELDARLVAEHIAGQLSMRVSYRRAMKKAIDSAMRLGAEGIKINVAGRLGGAEMSRSESYMEGSVPLHTLRADIDYSKVAAYTTYGEIGVKVWIYKGEVFQKDFKERLCREALEDSGRK
ncbi:MAG: 30S ribosomal protein S3 [Candidatus Latescibacteria bacterium]|nr:30S ribosomal protein S3 [bacterium]MBD3425230.1 30S ribosomal protein S3 [Candidatus Latescibacterota bacterium]